MHQFSPVAQSCPTLCDPMNHSTPSLPVHHQLPEFTQTYVHWVSDAIQSSHPLLFPSPPAFNLSQHQGLFKWVSSSHQVANYWSFNFYISPSSEHPGLIWLDLLAVQGTLSSLLQHHSSKASILQHSVFFIVQLSWYEVNIKSHFLKKISKIIQHHLLKISFSIELFQQSVNYICMDQSRLPIVPLICLSMSYKY